MVVKEAAQAMVIIFWRDDNPAIHDLVAESCTHGGIRLEDPTWVSLCIQEGRYYHPTLEPKDVSHALLPS